MTSPKALPITCAQLDWTEDDTPVSREFDDIYFSKHSGIEETRFVFLQHNQLPERLAAPDEKKQAYFCVGETGFGTGLNFLCTWQLRDQVAPNTHLHFVSVEKYPLSQPDLKQALSAWPELRRYADHLITNYPALTPGWHHISFIEARVELDLYLGDALEGYQDYQANIDAWFLDGFAPSKNITMWSKALFSEIARLSSADASFSTFSAAADVREGLKNAGFSVQRVKGFANKRHMLRGEILRDQPTPMLNTRESKAPWFAPPKRGKAKFPEAVVIGGGIAGVSAAYSLARRGWQITLLERKQNLGSEASGNRQGVLYNKISAEPSIHSNFYTAGYLYATRLFNQLGTNAMGNSGWHPCGVLQLAYDEKERNRQSQFLTTNPQPSSLVYPVDEEQARKISDVRLDSGGLFYPAGGWATPSIICQHLAAHPQIKIELGVEVNKLLRDGDDWLLLNAKGQTICHTKTLIIANAGHASQFEFTQNLPLKSIRGQTTDIPANPEVNLKTVLCGKGYIGPPVDGRHYMGATFNLDSEDSHCRVEDHQNNLHEIAKMAPYLAQAHRFDKVLDQDISGRVGFRCASPDYLPLIGPVPNQAVFIQRYAKLRKDARTRFSETGEYYSGLYISVGHGSKGMTSCPLGGELLAAYINGEPFPFSSQLIHALNPARFLIRDLMRNKI